MTYQLIELSVEQGIATLRLNRPEKRNAMSDDMRTEFIHALEHVSAEKSIRALIITGAGKGFCAGGDVAGEGAAAGLAERGSRRARRRREQRLDDFEREVGRRFDAVNVDLDRLYRLFNMPRTTPQEPHE